MSYPPMVYSHLSIHATWWNSREEKDVHLLALQMLCRFIAETGSFNYQSAQKDPWLDVAFAYDFDTHTRDDIIELASTRVSQHPSLQQNRTWKPFLSASASGRCAGQGAELGQDEIQFIKNSQSTGLCLEPWVKRTKDYSSQFWLTESEVYWLSSTYQLVTPAGRYRGLETTRQLNRTPIFQPDDPIFSRHRALALELKGAGYSGPAGDRWI